MREVPDFEGMYAVSVEGEVISLPRSVKGKDGLLYPIKGKKLIIQLNKQTGYRQVDLWKNNTGKRFYLHRLLAEIYIPNPSNKPEVNHIDSDRSNNSISNLEWVTSSENSLHGYTHGFASQKLRRKLVEDDYLLIFTRFMAGESFATIILDYDISAGRLSVNLRSLVIKWGRESEFILEKLRQQQIRARSNGSN